MNVLITGGTGSLGTRLTRHFLAQGHQVTILSRNAHRQAELLQELAYPPNLYPILGDICDPDTTERALKDQEVVIHAAAQKRIERGETDQNEYLRINVLGTRIVANEALRQRTPCCLFISTDKAVAPVNFYGCTKALAERYWCAQNNGRSRFLALRYGNVIESKGAVWHKWLGQLERGEQIDVRVPEPTRFVLSLTYAVTLVEQALSVGLGGVVLVPGNLMAFSIWDLARQLVAQKKWACKPLACGEKQHEVLLAPGEMAQPVTSELWAVRWRVEEQGLDPRFCSATAPRLSGLEITQRFGWQPIEGNDGIYSRSGFELVAP